MHCTELHVKTSLFYWMFVSVYISVETGHEEVKWLSSFTGSSFTECSRPWGSRGPGAVPAHGEAGHALPSSAGSKGSTRGACGASARAEPPEPGHCSEQSGNGCLGISALGANSSTCAMKPFICGSKK